MRFLNALIPARWQQFDHYLLTHYPNLWRTRIHQLIAICTLLGTAFFLLGYFRPYEMSEVVCSEHYLVYHHDFFIFPVVIFAGLGLIFWRLKLREFTILPTDNRQLLLLFFTTILGMGTVYYAGAAFFLGYNLRASMDIERSLADDKDFLQAHNYLQLEGMVTFRDKDLFIHPIDYFQKGEELVLPGRVFSYDEPDFDIYNKGISVSYPHHEYIEYALPLNCYTLQEQNFDISNWEADSLVHYVRYQLEQEEKIRATQQHTQSTYYRTSLYSNDVVKYLPKLTYESLAPLIERYSDLQLLKDYTNIMPPMLLHVQLEWYRLSTDFYASLNSQEVASYQAYRVNLIDNWIDGLGIAGSLLISEFQTFSQSPERKEDMGFLDEESYELYKKMCYYYRSEMPINIDKISHVGQFEEETVTKIITNYFAQHPLQNTADSLYFYQPGQGAIDQAMQFRLTAFTYYQIWLKELDVYYQSKFSAEDQQRFIDFCKKLGLNNTFTNSGGLSHKRDDWQTQAEREHTYSLATNFTFESQFMLPILVKQIENRQVTLKKQKSALLFLQIDEDLPFLGPLLLLLASMAFFFLSVFNLQVLLISSLAASLVTFGMVAVGETIRGNYEVELILGGHLLLCLYVFYRLALLSYQNFRSQIWLCSILMITSMLPIWIIEFSRPYSENGFTQEQVVSFAFLYALFIYLLLFIGYLKQKHLPMKK